MFEYICPFGNDLLPSLSSQAKQIRENHGQFVNEMMEHKDNTNEQGNEASNEMNGKDDKVEQATNTAETVIYAKIPPFFLQQCLYCNKMGCVAYEMPPELQNEWQHWGPSSFRAHALSRMWSGLLLFS